MEDNNVQNQINIKLDQTKEIKCKCGNNRFQQVLMVREISGILIGAKENKQLHFPVLECSQCGELLKESLPAELQ